MKNLYVKQAKKTNKKGERFKIRARPSYHKSRVAAKQFRKQSTPFSSKKGNKISIKKQRGTFVKKYNKKKVRSQKFLSTKKKILKPTFARNIVFYKNIENIYGSYWLGKFINTLQKEGKKKKAAKFVYDALKVLRYSTNKNPLLFFLEIMDRIKPTFKLQNYVTRRVEIKQYPIAVVRSRRLIVALHWIKQQILDIKSKSISNKSFYQYIFIALKQFNYKDTKNMLIIKRTEHMERSIKGQFNIRFAFRRR